MSVAELEDQEGELGAGLNQSRRTRPQKMRRQEGVQRILAGPNCPLGCPFVFAGRLVDHGLGLV